MMTSTSTLDHEDLLQQSSVVNAIGSAVSYAALALRIVSNTAGLATQKCYRDLSASTVAIAESESETRFRAIAPEIRLAFESIVWAVREQSLEDGLSNAVSERLGAYILHDPQASLQTILVWLQNESEGGVLAAEILKEVGRTRDAASYFRRQWILEHALTSFDPATRDGAAQGLSWMADVHALAALRRAVAVEQLPQLRRDLQAVVDELEAARENGAAAAEGNEA